MNRCDRFPGQHRGLRERTPIAVTLATLLIALTVVATPAAGVAAEGTERVMATVRDIDVGPGALVNTLGLRSAKFELAGKYVTIADGQRRLQARVANQLFAEFGVFRDQQGRFKLLGADGRWVKLLLNKKMHRHEVGTWSNSWAAGWSFKLTRPAAEVDGSVKSELEDAQIDSRQVVCVLAYSPLGALRGLLAVSNSGVMLLDRTAKCGDDTAALFITDSLRKGADPGALVRGVPIDPVTYVRFVPPDRPGNNLSDDERRLMRNEIDSYFDTLLDYNGFLQNDVRSAVQTTANGLMATSYTIPGEAKKALNLAEFFTNRASYILDLLGPYGQLASGVVKSTYDTVELGINIAHNANLQGPRVVESVTNDVLGTANEIVNAYDSAFLKFAQNLENMRDSIKEGCSDAATCASDRKLHAWKQADPMKNIAEQVTALSRAHQAAAHELAIWRKLLPIRGLLHAPRTPRDLINYPSKGSYWDCSPGYPYNQPFRNEDVLNWYAKYVQNEVDPTWGVPVLTAGLYYPYYNWYTCSGGTVRRPYRLSWVLGLANNDPTVTPLSTNQLKRLFDAWDPDEPITSGFGLSRSEVACGWLKNPARPSQIGSANYFYSPCHSAFYNVGGAVVSPYQGEPNTRYADALFYSVSYWTPAAAELAAGRHITDPDVVSPSVPDLTFGSCAAFDSGATKSAAGGAAVKVYFTNLHDGAIDVYRVRADGLQGKLLFTLPRQNQLARPLYRQGEFKVNYSSLLNTTAGASFLVRKNGTNECIGTWTARRLPAGAPVDYSVAEVHGSDGILF